MACCGRAAGSSLLFEARSNTGGTQTFKTNVEARLFLAKNGGGTVKNVPAPRTDGTK